MCREEKKKECVSTMYKQSGKIGVFSSQDHIHTVYIHVSLFSSCPVEEKRVKEMCDGYLGLNYDTDYPFQHSEKWTHAVIAVRRMDGENMGRMLVGLAVTFSLFEQGKFSAFSEV